MEHMAALTITLVVCLGLCGAAPTTISSDAREIAEAYLSKFYTDPDVNESNRRSVSIRDIEKDLRNMQEFFGLEVTGKLDTNTLEVMKKPRCGVTDVAKYKHLQGKPRWKQSIVTYRITEYTSKLSQREVDATIAKAFQLYSDVIPLDFKQIYTGTADIMILFKAGYHGDFKPFDGRSGELAHASPPDSGGYSYAHFDEDEEWTLSSQGTNLLLVAAHEFGHALGLDHSQDRSALMYPNYQYVNTNGYTLPRDDRFGVQALYGIRTHTENSVPTPELKPYPEWNPPEPCMEGLEFDAATSIRGELYFFKNGYYWKKGLYSGLSTHKIKSTWPYIDSVDAAYEIASTDTTFLFKGQQYWAIRGTMVLPGYPKRISELGFPSSVNQISAAVHVAWTGHTLFFVGQRYWSFNEWTAQMEIFSRPIHRSFPGIGSRVDAAFENYGFLYLSNGQQQYEYDFFSKRVNRVLYNYVWLDCYYTFSDNVYSSPFYY